MRIKYIFKRLIEKATGSRVVPHDEQLAEFIEESFQQPEPQRRRKNFSQHLSEDLIIIWKDGVTKEQAVADLHAAIAHGNPEVDLKSGFRRIAEREAEMSMFLNEGIAVPHACVTGIPQIYCALGIAKSGVSDTHSEVPIHSVFMALYPEEQSARYLEVMSGIAAFTRNRQAAELLKDANTPRDVLELIIAFEG